MRETTRIPLIPALTLAASVALSSSAARADALLWSDGFEWGNVCHWSGRTGSADSCPYDLSCAGLAFPTTAVDPLSISGVLMSLSAGPSAPISGATVTSYRRDDDTELDSDTTGLDGSFSVSLETGGTPLDAYAKVVASSYADSYVYPADPGTEDVTGLQLRSIASSVIPGLYFLGGASMPAGTGTAIVVVADCSEVRMAGAMVQLSPAPNKVGYFSSGSPNSSATSTDVDGIAVGYGVPAGDSTVTATWAGIPLESHVFEMTTGAVSFTVIHP